LRRLLIHSLAVTVAVAALASSSAAVAQKRAAAAADSGDATTRGEKPSLAVVPFTGPQAIRAEAVVVRTLRKKAQLIPGKTWQKSASKLFANTHSPEDIAAVADDVSARIVITGAVKRDGRAWQLSISVRDGSDGKPRARLKYPLKGPRIMPATLTLLAKEVADSFDSVVNGEGTTEEGTPAPPATKPGKKPPVTDLSPPTTTPPPTTPPPATTEPAGKDEELAPVAAKSPKPIAPVAATGKRPRWAPWFEVDAGLSITGRQFDFDTTQPPHFTSGVVPGIAADLTVNPLAFTWNKAGGVFSGLGVGATIEKPFWPDSTSKTDMTQHFATSELKVEGGLRWRITLYKPVPRPELLLAAGGGLHTFSLAKDATGQDVGPPDVAYKYVDFGIGVRLHFAEWAYLTAKFNYHLVVNSGPISDVATEYGPTATTGLRFGGALDFIIYKGLKVGLDGFYERFGLKFVPGNTSPAKQANAAVDQYFGGVITVGYVL
jgi:TolB-like protein